MTNDSLKSYRDSTDLILSNRDSVPIHEHINLPDVGNGCVSSVIIPLSNREWH